MSKREDILYIQDILEAIERIENHTQGFSSDKFAGDMKTIDAVLRNFSVIGEGANNISRETRKEFGKIPWIEIIGMRNKVIHEYFGVDEEVLWKTIEKDLPELKREIKKIIKNQK